jgi:hypothetical protein
MDSEREKELSAKLMALRQRGLDDPGFKPEGIAYFHPYHGYWFTDVDGKLLKTDNCFFMRGSIGRRLKALVWRVTEFGAVIVDDYTEVTDGATKR